MRINDFIIQYFLNKNDALTASEILSLNYVENNLFNSIEFIEMIADFEAEFQVTFQDEHLKSKEFETVGGLIKLVNHLVKIDETA